MFSITDFQSLFPKIVKRGSRYFTNCPFHEDSDPSFTINLKSGRYRCFGCGESGWLKELPKKMGKSLFLQESAFETNKEKEIIIRPISMEVVDTFVSNLKSFPSLFDRIYKRIPDKKTIEYYKIGYSIEQSRYTIPIIENGVCWNIKFISFTHKVKQYNWSKGYGIPRLYLYEEIKNQDRVIVAAGEWDCLLLRSMGFPAVTNTAGESTWLDKWEEYFQEKEVYIVYDQDSAGISGAKNVASKLFQSAKSVKIVSFDIDMGKGGDTSDYFLKFGKGKKDFIECLRNAAPFVPEIKRTKFFGK